MQEMALGKMWVGADISCRKPWNLGSGSRQVTSMVILSLTHQKLDIKPPSITVNDGLDYQPCSKMIVKIVCHVFTNKRNIRYSIT